VPSSLLAAAELLDVAVSAGVLVDATASVEELEDAAAVELLDVAAALLELLEDLLVDVAVDPDPHPARRVATIAALINVATTLRFMLFLL
jgi:hypothetical protein